MMSRVEVGVVVLMPTFAVVPVPDWNTTELPCVLAPVHIGRKFVVPAPVIVAGGSEPGDAVVPVAVAPEAAGCADRGAASINADGGSPPIVSASAAFKA